MIWGLVLAAGESRRMGRRKLLLPLDGQTVIEMVLAAVAGSRLNRAIVVIGPGSEDIAAIARRNSLEVVINPSPEKGMLSSLLCGLNSIPLEAEAVVVILGDQPGISSAVIDFLLVSYRLKGKGIVVPEYRGKRGHPILMDLKYRGEIETLNPEIGLRELLQRHPEDVLEITVNEPAILRDLDTPEDYLRLLRKPESKDK